MSDSVRPQRRQPTRLPRPWDSPGKNTGVGCHFLLQYMKVKSESEVAQSCLTLSDPTDCSPPGSSIHGIFQARVLEWGSRALYFFLPWPPAPLSTWCCQNTCDPSSCTTPPMALTRANPSPSGQPQEQTPVDDPHAEVEVKPQLKPRGSVVKEEDPKPHQLYKLGIKST